MTNEEFYSELLKELDSCICGECCECTENGNCTKQMLVEEIKARMEREKQDENRAD